MSEQERVVDVSILISSKNRLPLFRRTLHSIAARPPSCSFEVVVADDGSDQDILGELRRHDFPWTFIEVDSNEFAARTGYKPFWNCPALTNNVAFRHSVGGLIFQMGNEIIAWGTVFDDLMAAIPPQRYAWACSTTRDVPREVLDRLDAEGSNLSQADVLSCSNRVLSNDNNVPNYLSLFTRDAWLATGGYDERYVAGIGAEDSDFMRRCARLPFFRAVHVEGLSLHQYHGGVNHLYRPLPGVISEERLAEGAAINRRLYRSWDGDSWNGQSWPMGEIGVKRVVRE